MRGVLSLYPRAVTGRPQGRRARQNSHLSLVDAKTAPFRAWAMRGGVVGAGVFNIRETSAKHEGATFGAAGQTNFRAAESSAPKSTNGEAGVRTKGANGSGARDTARLPAS